MLLLLCVLHSWWNPWDGAWKLRLTCGGTYVHRHTVACVVVYRHNIGKQLGIASVGAQQEDSHTFTHAHFQMLITQRHTWSCLWLSRCFCMLLLSHACRHHFSSYSIELMLLGLKALLSVNFQDATPWWAHPSLTLSPVIHSCDRGWEWWQWSTEKWNREDPSRSLECSTHDPPKDTLEIFYGDI